MRKVALYISLTLFTLLVVTVVILPYIYVPYATYKGQDISGLRSEIAKKVCTIEAKETVIYTGNDTVIECPVSAIASCVCDKLPKVDYLKYYTFKVMTPSVQVSVDPIRLKELLEDYVVPCRDAYIDFQDNSFVLQPEQIGFSFNDIDSAVVTLADNFNYVNDCTDLLDSPKIVVNDLQSTFDKVSWLNDFYIEYDNNMSISAKDILVDKLENGDVTEYVKCFTENNITTDFSGFVEKLAKSYDTVGNQMSFKKSDGTIITVRYNTYGQSLDKEKEKEFIVDAVTQHKQVNDRTPVLKGYDDYKDTYIEVSIEDQHVWVYKDGDMIMESDIVTGKKGAHDTPKGVFYISERIPGKFLVGEGYRSWVNRWMRLNNNGIGLHDAAWRGSFGKNIYTYNGSHGCVNLPKKFAYDLYEQTYVGMPVVVY